MSLWSRMLSPLKSGRSDIEFAITATAAATCVEIIVQKPENYSNYQLNDAIERGRHGVYQIAKQKSAPDFISDRILLDFACKEILGLLEKRLSKDFESVNLFWKGKKHFYDLHMLIITMNDYAGHNLARARDGSARLSLDLTNRFNDNFRGMVRNAFNSYTIDINLIDPLGFEIVNWETLGPRRK